RGRRFSTSCETVAEPPWVGAQRNEHVPSSSSTTLAPSPTTFHPSSPFSKRGFAISSRRALGSAAAGEVQAAPRPITAAEPATTTGGKCRRVMSDRTGSKVFGVYDKIGRAHV